ncbi:uncharacterized protein LOC143298739 isoform X2 [Babylonia areolata]
MATGGGGSRRCRGSEEWLEHLMCSVCWSVYQDPRLLPCHHSFCLPCLQALAALFPLSFPCPLCRTDTTVPQGGVSTFPNNFHLRSEDLEEARRVEEEVNNSNLGNAEASPPQQAAPHRPADTATTSLLEAALLAGRFNTEEVESAVDFQRILLESILSEQREEDEDLHRVLQMSLETHYHNWPTEPASPEPGQRQPRDFQAAVRQHSRHRQFGDPRQQQLLLQQRLVEEEEQEEDDEDLQRVLDTGLETHQHNWPTEAASLLPWQQQPGDLQAALASEALRQWSQRRQFQDPGQQQQLPMPRECTRSGEQHQHQHRVAPEPSELEGILRRRLNRLEERSQGEGQREKHEQRQQQAGGEEQHSELHQAFKRFQSKRRAEQASTEEGRNVQEQPRHAEEREQDQLIDQSHQSDAEHAEESVSDFQGISFDCFVIVRGEEEDFQSVLDTRLETHQHNWRTEAASPETGQQQPGDLQVALALEALRQWCQRRQIGDLGQQQQCAMPWECTKSGEQQQQQQQHSVAQERNELEGISRRRLNRREERSRGEGQKEEHEEQQARGEEQESELHQAFKRFQSKRRAEQASTEEGRTVQEQPRPAEQREQDQVRDQSYQSNPEHASENVDDFQRTSYDSSVSEQGEEDEDHQRVMVTSLETHQHNWPMEPASLLPGQQQSRDLQAAVASEALREWSQRRQFGDLGQQQQRPMQQKCTKSGEQQQRQQHSTASELNELENVWSCRLN